MIPNLVLDFTAASLSPIVSLTRSGATATRVNSAGYIETVAADTPRFDYNPITLACKGLLIEESKTNLAKYSNDFRNTTDAGETRPWAYNALSVTTGSVTAPDGSASAYVLVESNTNASHFDANTIGTGGAGTYTMSVYAKKKERSFVYLLENSTVSAIAYFNLDTGTKGTVSGTGSPSSTITNIGGGWYRCTMTCTTTANPVMRVGLCITDNVRSYQGDGASGIYVFGSQIEAGAEASSYIPTTSAAVTRNADVATITGTNFSDWWQASKGGAQVQAIPSTVSGIRPLVQYDDGTANEIIALRGNTTNPELYVVDGGTPQAQLDAGTIAANTAYSLTGWWATNDCKARKDSGVVVTDATATIPTVTQARLGSDGTNYLNGHLASISYYDTFSSQIYTRRKNKAVFSLL